MTFGSTYNWTIDNQSIATINNGNGTNHILVDLNNSGFCWLYIEETNSNLCVGKDSILIEVYAKPSPYIYDYGNAILCEGDFMTLISDSIYTSQLWSNGLDTDTIMVFDDGNYFLEVTDTNGCKNISNSIDVYFYSTPNADFWIDGICLESETNLIDSSTITSGNIVSWIWDLGDGFYNTGPEVTHYYSDVGLYNVSLIINTEFGCKDSIVRPIQIFHIPEADFEFFPYSASTLFPDIYFTNLSQNSIPILWDFGDGSNTMINNPSHVFSYPGIHEVTLYVSDTNNCFDSVSKKITVFYDFILYVPNTFTPNKDGKNEIFIPKGFRMDEYDDYTFLIYDRWGEIVFLTNDINEGWDGENAISGKYAWTILINDELGEIRKKVGEVMVIK